MKRMIGIFMAAAMMVGCSNDIEGPQSENEVGKETAYMAVQILTDKTMESRAPEDDVLGFEAGDEKESTISNACFFFFDDNGNPFAVDGGNNYLIKIFESGAETGEDKNTVLVLSKLNGAFPTKMVTLVNLPENLLKSPEGDSDPTQKITPLSLDDLKNKIFEKSNDAETSFTMSTSVFDNSDEENAKADVDKTGITIIGESNLKASSDAAKANPVPVRVERLWAKFIVTENSGYNTTKVSTIQYSEVDGKLSSDKSIDVYADIVGWNVTGVLEKMPPVKSNSKPISRCYLLKNLGNLTTDKPLTIGANHTSYGLLGSFGNTEFTWNDQNAYRSYWAVSPMENMTFVYDKTPQDLNNKIGNENPVYVAENTPPFTSDLKSSSFKDNDFFTKLIVKATYHDVNNNPVIPAEWMGNMYTEEGLLNEMANVVFDKLYILDEVKKETSVAKLLNLVKARSRDNNVKNNYQSKAVLLDVDKVKENLSSKFSLVVNGKEYAVENITEAVIDDANLILNQLALAKVWKEGGYYYLNVEHLGGNYGVVRNHVYKYEISSIQGLGTPICKEDKEIIEPEKPEDDESYVAAKLEVLSWKIINHEVELK